jgi:hypothetical protein
MSENYTDSCSKVVKIPALLGKSWFRKLVWRSVLPANLSRDIYQFLHENSQLFL